MPELPEVESLRRSLIPVLRGRRLGRCTIHRQDVCLSVDDAGKASQASAEQLLDGTLVNEILRHGKHLALVSPGRVLSVHLGMSGVLEVRGEGMLPSHTHVTWELGGGDRLVFSDPRRFGGLTAYASLDALKQRVWGRLGPDATDARGADLRRAGEQSRRAVKALLLDQTVVAGVGNIYADESLFVARVNPLALCRSLDEQSWDRLGSAISWVLSLAIERGGSTIRTYRNGTGDAGRAQESHAVYGRGGQPCLNCGLILSQGTVCQRTTVWCDACQGQQ